MTVATVSNKRVLTSDRARQFSNRRDIYNVAKAVHGNRSDSHCNWSETRTSVLLVELY